MIEVRKLHFVIYASLAPIRLASLLAYCFTSPRAPITVNCTELGLFKPDVLPTKGVRSYRPNAQLRIYVSSSVKQTKPLTRQTASLDRLVRALARTSWRRGNPSVMQAASCK